MHSNDPNGMQANDPNAIQPAVGPPPTATQNWKQLQHQVVEKPKELQEGDEGYSHPLSYYTSKLFGWG
jgi:hypothetical protein